MVLQQSAPWLGWTGTVLFLALWLSIRWMSTPLLFWPWIGLMVGSIILCLLGAAYDSRFFFLPAVGAFLLTIFMIMAAVAG
jgi:hypothetical protein